MKRPEDMPGGEERTFSAALGQLPNTALFVQAFCESRGLGAADALRITLVVEELFTNTIVHGYHGDSDATIRVALAVDGDAVALFYEDRAPAHDPLSASRGSAADPDATLGSRPVGGLGMVLITGLVEGARYAREADCNRLWLRLRYGG